MNEAEIELVLHSTFHCYPLSSTQKWEECPALHWVLRFVFWVLMSFLFLSPW